MSSQLRHKRYTVAWICALPLELAAAKEMLDETHDRLPQHRSDNNAFTLGRINGYNVVIACLPKGDIGLTPAATVLADMRATFPSLEFGLMVGVGGGVPGTPDIRLGDVVVSTPTKHGSGVIPYDHGKTVRNGSIVRTGYLNKPGKALLTAVSDLESDHYRGQKSIKQIIDKTLDKNKDLVKNFSRPRNDLLFYTNYSHKENAPDCSSCDVEELIDRPARNTDEPCVHHGLVASGNNVMKHAATRDRIAQELGIICFEMEAAGLMDQLNCLVIRGICDYCDSHKNDEWQGYAALTAAIYAKLLLSATRPASSETHMGQSSACENIQDSEQTRYQGKLEESKKNSHAIDSTNRQSLSHNIPRSPKQTCVFNVFEECGQSRIVIPQKHVESIQHNGAGIRSSRKLKGHSKLVTSVAFSPDGKILVSGSLDMTIRLCDSVTGALIRELTGHSDRVDIIAFSPDGKFLASGSRDRTVRLWDVATGNLISKLRGNSDGVNVLFFSPDGRLLAFGSRNRMVNLWDIATQNIHGKFNHQLGIMNTLAFSPNGKVIASGTGDGKLRLWNNAIDVCQQMQEVSLQNVESVVFSPDGSALACEVGREIVLWDTTTCTVRSTLRGHSQKINTIVFSPDGSRIASGSHDKTVRLWDTATGATISTLRYHSDRVNAVAFSPDGTLILSGCQDKKVRLHNVSTGLTCAFEGYWGSNNNSVAFSPDGKVIAYPLATAVIIHSAVIMG